MNRHTTVTTKHSWSVPYHLLSTLSMAALIALTVPTSCRAQAGSEQPAGRADAFRDHPVDSVIRNRSTGATMVTGSERPDRYTSPMGMMNELKALDAEHGGIAGIWILVSGDVTPTSTECEKLYISREDTGSYLIGNPAAGRIEIKGSEQDASGSGAYMLTPDAKTTVTAHVSRTPDDQLTLGYDSAHYFVGGGSHPDLLMHNTVFHGKYRRVTLPGSSNRPPNTGTAGSNPAPGSGSVGLVGTVALFGLAGFAAYRWPWLRAKLNL